MVWVELVAFGLIKPFHYELLITKTKTDPLMVYFEGQRSVQYIMFVCFKTMFSLYTRFKDMIISCSNTVISCFHSFHFMILTSKISYFLSKALI